MNRCYFGHEPSTPLMYYIQETTAYLICLEHIRGFKTTANLDVTHFLWQCAPIVCCFCRTNIKDKKLKHEPFGKTGNATLKCKKCAGDQWNYMIPVPKIYLT